MLPKGPYNSKQEEPEILKYWLEKQFFKPEFHPEKGLQSTDEMKKDGREPYCFVNPPPNAYMRPHIGNVSGYAYQDVFLRYNRMLGKKVLGQPGKDHAGIQGEVTVEKIFIDEGLGDKQSLGREKFYQAAYQHFEKLMPVIMQDEQRIGLSSDYERNIFTLDPRVIETVLNTFIKLYNDGMIYKGVRIVNWDPVAKTTLADIDTEHKDQDTELVYLNYPLKEPAGDIKYITVASTRAETMLGDTAVVVNPKDKRYASLIGKIAVLPLVNREIPVITSERVEIKFGSGAVKLTPAHAYDDYLIMNEWNDTHTDQQIGYINVVDKDAAMCGPVPEKYLGMNTLDCRKAVIDDLDALGLIVKKEPYQQTIVVGERSKAVIEPLMASQWFVDVEKLKQPAIEAVKQGKIQIHPKHMIKKYLTWMENLHDWPVTRSLWWGYRIPVWYKGGVKQYIDNQGQVCEESGGKVIKFPADYQKVMHVGLNPPKANPDGQEWLQDDDVLDTWFSSGQWPYATLTAHNLMETFYPTDVMETAYDILELWVSRMVMLGLYTQNEIPFKHVYLHGLVKAPDGQKMSKSKGNVIGPEEIIEMFGADALRLMYLVGNKAGTGYPVSYEKLEGYKRFLNKIWNASKFVLNFTADLKKTELEDLSFQNPKKITCNVIDQKLLKNLQELIAKVSKNIEVYRLGLASEFLYHDFWHNFCDIHLEDVKPRIYIKDRQGKTVNDHGPALQNRRDAQRTLIFTLKIYLCLLHPFIPFITERIWQELPKSKNEPETIMFAKWSGLVV